MRLFLSGEFVIFRADDWGCRRFVLTPVTRVARHFPMTIEVIFIDREHHAYHLARGLLRFLVILFKSAFQMTEIALDAQRGGDELHGWHELVGGNSSEYLDVLVNLLGSLKIRSTRRTLSGLSPQPGRSREEDDSRHTGASQHSSRAHSLSSTVVLQFSTGTLWTPASLGKSRAGR